MLNDDCSIEVLGEASSGEEAIDCCRTLKPDVVLMDLKMPGIGGLEAIRRINRVDETVRVVVVSAWTDDPYPSRVLEAGASAYVSKSSRDSRLL